jgi:tetratricopeptide (TPR) repeat protein
MIQSKAFTGKDHLLKPIPQPPLIRRHNAPLTPSEERRLLETAHPGDQRDTFATDPDAAIRKLGQLALRRVPYNVNDFFTLADLCAERSLQGDELRVFYVGKAVRAFRRVMEISEGERNFAFDSLLNFLRWIIEAAQARPTMRNLATALWAAAEIEGQTEALRPLISEVITTLARGRLLSDLTVNHTSEHGIELPISDILKDYPHPTTGPDLTTPPEDRTMPELSARPAAYHERSPQIAAKALDANDGGGDASDDNPTLPDMPLSARLIAARPLHPDEDFRPGDEVKSEDGRSSYKIEKVMSGGMGVVYLAFDLNEKIPVALKTIQSAVLNSGIPGIRERFYHEALTWIQLGKHPNIVQARTIQTINGRPHIVLEYISGAEGLGTDLRGWITHRQLDLTLCLQFALQIAWAMGYATQQRPGLVHRDLKPANILISVDGIAKVTDFGLVYSLADREIAAGQRPAEDVQLTRAGTIMGTAAYMSPEQARAESVDQRADIYALGILLFEMLTGQLPFPYLDWEMLVEAHTQETPRFPPIAEKTIPAPIREFTLRCLAKSVTDRPADWDAVIRDLTALYQAQTGEAPANLLEGEKLELQDRLGKAYGLAELGHLTEALTEYDHALEAYPDSPHLWARKGRAHRIAGQIEAAITALEQALYLNPEFAWAWRQYGVALDMAGRHAAALSAFEKAVALRPQDSWSTYNLAKLLVHLNRRDEALNYLNSTVENDPNHAQSHNLLGELLLEMGQTTDALNAFDAALRINPNAPVVWRRKGNALRKLGRLEEAVAAYRQAATSDRSADGAWKWYTLGDTLRELKRYPEALGAAQQALRADPSYVKAWTLQADVLLHLGRYDEALNAADQAVRLEPASSWLHRVRAVLLDRLNRPNEALAAYDSAIRLKENDAWAWQGRGLILLRMDKRPEALQAFQKAETFAPEGIRFWLRQAEALLRAREYDRTLAAVQKIHQIDPQNLEGFRLAGTASLRRGRFIPALDAFNAALQITQDNDRVWDGRGQTLMEMEDYAEALACFENAVNRAPRNLWYRLRMIEPLLKLGYLAEAQDTAEGVTRTDSNSAEAWEALGRVLMARDQPAEALSAFEQALQHNSKLGRAWYGKGKAYSALGDEANASACFGRVAELRRK